MNYRALLESTESRGAGQTERIGGYPYVGCRKLLLALEDGICAGLA